MGKPLPRLIVQLWAKALWHLFWFPKANGLILLHCHVQFCHGQLHILLLTAKICDNLYLLYLLVQASDVCICFLRSLFQFHNSNHRICVVRENTNNGVDLTNKSHSSNHYNNNINNNNNNTMYMAPIKSEDTEAISSNIMPTHCHTDRKNYSKIQKWDHYIISMCISAYQRSLFRPSDRPKFTLATLMGPTDGRFLLDMIILSTEWNI